MTARLAYAIQPLHEFLEKQAAYSAQDFVNHINTRLEDAAAVLAAPVSEVDEPGGSEIAKRNEVVAARLKEAAAVLLEPIAVGDVNAQVEDRRSKAAETLSKPLPAIDLVAAELRNPDTGPHVLKPFGLSFSGGGIRSATFNLGIIQGLAENGLLGQVDYLSTVSGGGYIGSWLHAFIKDRCKSKVNEACRQLSPIDSPIPLLSDTDPVTFLRKYSNYLAPRPGLFGADTWVIGSIWLRNVLLNQLILIPALSALIVAAYLFLFGQQWPVIRLVSGFRDGIPLLTMPFVAVVLVALTLPIAVGNLLDIVERCGLPNQLKSKWPQRLKWFREKVPSWVVPMLIVVAAIVMACGDTGERIRASSPTLPGRFWLLGSMFFLLFLALQICGGFRLQYKHAHKGDRGIWFWSNFHPLWMSAVCAILMVTLLDQLWTFDSTWTEWMKVTLGPPLVSAAIMASIALLIGLMGVDYPDVAREWLARAGALVALASAGWLVFFSLALYGPYWVATALGAYGKTTTAAIVAWVGTGAAGLLAGRSARTGEPNEAGQSSAADWLVTLAPPLVMVAYLLLLSVGVHQVFAATLDLQKAALPPAKAEALQVDVRVPPAAEPVEISINRSSLGGLDRLFDKAAAFADSYYPVLDARVTAPHRLRNLWIMLAVCVVVTLVASARININEFSLHNFYKNRLVRCYLGASHTGAERRPNPFTGFDPRDDFALSLLSTEHGYFGPYALVNTTLNVNVGIELSQQERKGASFMLSPHYCGFDVRDKAEERSSWFPRDKFEVCGYRKTRADKAHGLEHEGGYSDPNGPTVGQAMAISGAAANPNWGYSTSAAVAFLLTIFDGRLGWWLGNPRWKNASRRPGPSFALNYLLAELTANTTARTRFVNLSDGGHFENLGLYELVKRRCRYIIVCDGEQDGSLTFGSLGGAVRKCRADFGVEIDIDPSPIKIKDKTGRSGVHCVVGTIVYPETDPLKPVAMTAANGTGAANGPLAAVGPATTYARGWLLYLKSSLTGNEPADVLEYQSENPDFPHQSTGDQFFSESQFESYRRLGLHVLREAFEGVTPTRKPGDWRVPMMPSLTNVFQQLTTKWYAKIPVEAKAASELNDDYSKLVNRLSDANLSGRMSATLASAVQPADWKAEWGPWPTKEQFVFIVEQLQLMENVFGEYEFEHRARRANPRNRGWMTVFKQWVKDDAFYNGVWPRVKHSYNPVFQEFITRLHDDDIDDVPLQN